MDEFQVNFPGGDFRSGELNMEGAIPSVGVMRGASTSAARAGAALHNATARIVEIGGQFDTQAMAASQGDVQPTAADTAEGNELRARAARFHAQHARERPTGSKGSNTGQLDSGQHTVPNSPAQLTGSGSAGGSFTGTPREVSFEILTGARADPGPVQSEFLSTRQQQKQPAADPRLEAVKLG